MSRSDDLPMEPDSSSQPPPSERPSTSTTDAPLTLSEDSQAGSVSATAVDPSSVPSSEALIPHLSTDDGIPRSSSSVKIQEAPLTPEVYASGALPPGTMLGHFVIKSFIGGGGMGRVYLATDSSLDRKVALKVLPRQRANDQGTVARFMNEARSAARLNHEHIAQVYFAGEQAGIPFIVFEYVEGTNIRTLVEENGLFPLPQAITFLIQIAHALSHAAEHGVIHRDVKPSNILITTAGRAKLIDMGLARLLDPSESKADLTASGVTLGTFDYISPEQARDPRAADIRSDIYSLGCTFFFMLTGRPPFPEGTVLQKLLQHQGDEPPDVRTFQPNIPSEVALLIQKMMAKDPRQRFQTPSLLVDSLIQVAEMLGLRPTEPGKLDWAMGSPTRMSIFEKHVPWFAAVAALFVLFVGLHFLWNRAILLPLPTIPQTEVSEPPEIQSSTETFVPRTSPVVQETVQRLPSPFPTTERGAINLLPVKRVDAALQHFLPTPVPGSIDGQWTDQERLDYGLGSAAISASWCVSNSKTEVFESVPFSRIQESVVLSSGSGNVAPTRLTVDPSGKTSNSFLSLGAALAEAGKQATIELKWNGTVGIDPISFVGRELKIAASPGYSPMLSFKPTDTTFSSQNSRSMFTVSGSTLELQGIAVEMEIDREVLASRWTLFELFGSGKLSFFRCCLTIRNAKSDFSAYHQEVAFFRNSPQQVGFESLTVDNPLPLSEAETSVSAASKSGIRIQLSDSLLRGEANALLCETSQAIDFRLEHSFAALAKTFIQTEDVKRTSRQESSVHVLLDHAFVYSRHSLARQNRTATISEPLRLNFDVRSSIIRLNRTPLAELQGASFPAKDDTAFLWSGSDNYFQNVSLGWKLRPINPLAEPETANEMTLAEWKDRMNVFPSVDHLTLPEIRKATHQLTPTDLLPESLAGSLDAGPNPERTLRLPND